MRVIDLETWERKSHYKWFSSFADPSIAFDVKMDVTLLREYCKLNGLSSYAIIMYIICECINDNRACRLRILDDQIVEIDKANVAYTIMTTDSCFVNCRANLQNGYEHYLQQVKQNQQKYNNSSYVQEEYNDTKVIDDIYCSCVPWLNFASVKQPIPDKLPESNCIPRACWGKYYTTQEERVCMTLNITANHALVDGLDLANVFNDIQRAFDDVENFINKRK
ncbi:MAG: CatA-like O-acetyltransferase [Christensenellales bacterium]